ncbi:MAG: SiaC family regulatory phosphoprotein, partial [Bacteroidota bacterium]
YFENPKPLSRFIFKLTYFNTASSKVIQDILLRLNEYAESGHNIELDWYYDKDDEDILESGEEFRDAVDFPMNLHRLDY